MIGLIVTGHGHFGTGLTSSLDLIAGKQENYVAVDFLAEDSTDTLVQKFEQAFEQLDTTDGVLVLSDLAGGSPFKTMVETSLSKDFPVRVIAGTNLGMLIEISMTRQFESDVEKLADMAVSTGQSQVMKFTMPAAKQEDDDLSDGI